MWKQTTKQSAGRGPAWAGCFVLVVTIALQPLFVRTFVVHAHDAADLHTHQGPMVDQHEAREHGHHSHGHGHSHGHDGEHSHADRPDDVQVPGQQIHHHGSRDSLSSGTNCHHDHSDHPDFYVFVQIESFRSDESCPWESDHPQPAVPRFHATALHVGEWPAISHAPPGALCVRPPSHRSAILLRNHALLI